MRVKTFGGEGPRPRAEARAEGQAAGPAAVRPAPDRAPQPALELEDASFSYAVPAGEPAGPDVVSHASARVPAGAFALLVGGTGSGKTTLLKLFKPEIRPQGALSGAVRVLGRDAAAMSARESAESVGYVFQSPDSQIVCDSVWHELAFGLENLGVPQDQMRRRVAETCYFFGMEPWFHRRCADLSGGQRQLLALASALAMRPSVLLLDEPTSMLDPVAEKGFLSLLRRVNRELGCTVVVEDENGKRFEYKITGSQEANPMENKLSDDSPFGRGIVGKAAGEKFTVNAPAGSFTMKVISVSREG